MAFSKEYPALPDGHDAALHLPPQQGDVPPRRDRRSGKLPGRDQRPAVLVQADAALPRPRQPICQPPRVHPRPGMLPRDVLSGVRRFPKRRKYLCKRLGPIAGLFLSEEQHRWIPGTVAAIVPANANRRRMESLPKRERRCTGQMGDGSIRRNDEVEIRHDGRRVHKWAVDRVHVAAGFEDI